MNKKAQALALFITLIPVIFVVVMFVYESSVFVNKKSNTESILESTMMDAKKYNLSDDEIIDLLKENGISEDDIEIVNHDKEKIITIKVKYPVINKTYEIKSKIKQGICHQIFRCVHETQNDRGEHNSQNRDHEASHDGKGNGCVKSILKIFFIARPVILGDNNRRTGRKANEEADDQVNDLAGRAAHAG